MSNLEVTLFATTVAASLAGIVQGWQVAYWRQRWKRDAEYVGKAARRALYFELRCQELQGDTSVRETINELLAESEAP